MVELDSSRGSWSSVRDPETDEYVSLDDDVDQEVADRLVDEYDPLSIADGDDADEESDDTDTDEGDDDELGELLDGTVQDVEDAIESGEYDDRLDEIADRDNRVTVQQAVEDRRSDIEDEEA